MGNFAIQPIEFSSSAGILLARALMGTTTDNILTMGEITRLLDLARQGDEDAQRAFFTQIHTELERLARFHLDKHAPLTLIDPPALIREAYLRIANQEVLPGRDRNGFLSYASQAMHSVIVDYVRARKSQRHRHRAITLATHIGNESLTEPQIELLIDALDELAQVDARAHRVVEMRFFGGMDIPDIAAVLGISPATIKRDWVKARAFLFHAIKNPG